MREGEKPWEATSFSFRVRLREVGDPASVESLRAHFPWHYKAMTIVISGMYWCLVYILLGRKIIPCLQK